jgi:MFS family permease
MLLGSSLLYASTSTAAGKLADRVGKAPVLIAGWGLYAGVYLGLAVAVETWHVWTLGVVYGLYHGLTFGTAKALIADLVEPQRRGMAFGTYAAVLGILDLPASAIAGVLWHGVGPWPGWGPGAPFLFGAAMAGMATLGLWRWARGAA